MLPFNLRNHVSLRRYLTEMNESKNEKTIGYNI